MNGQMEIDKKIVMTAMKTKIKDDKKRVKNLKEQIKTLEKKLVKCSEVEKTTIQSLINEAHAGLDEISRQTTGFLVQLISNAPTSKVATRIVKKMGYQTTEGFLATRVTSVGQDYTKDYLKGYYGKYDGTITDPLVLFQPEVAARFMPDMADLSNKSSKK